jgi:RNA polymerase sigma-70 factor, ECF subfamily
MRAQVSEGAHMLTGEAAESPRSRSQAEILRGVVQGERWANAALYDALHPVVIRTLQKILRDPAADYDDLVQTTFERIVRTLAHDRTTPVSSLFGWAGAITAHVALDALRVKIRERRLFSGDDANRRNASGSAVGPSLERQLEARHELVWVQGALARMNPEQAQTILLHDVLGHDLAETANATGVTVAAAQKRLSRARQDLLRRARRRTGETP